MLNMDKWVTPNHFSVTNFEEFDGLTPSQEFNLIAPIMIYFGADIKFQDKARIAARELKRKHHPLLDDVSVSEFINSTKTPSGLANRYNALMMKLVDEQAPEATAYIDSCGAFGFFRASDSGLFLGDSSSMFAYYANTEALMYRLSF